MHVLHAYAFDDRGSGVNQNGDAKFLCFRVAGVEGLIIYVELKG